MGNSDMSMFGEILLVEYVFVIRLVGALEVSR